MSRDFRLPHPENKADKYFPVRAFFNDIPDQDFIEVLEHFVNGIGYNYNYVTCLFPDSIDPWEEPFEGMRFFASDEIVTVDYKEAYPFLLEASRVYIEDRPKDKEAVEKLLKKFFDRYCR